MSGMDGCHTSGGRRNAEECIAWMCDTLVREFNPLQVVLFGSRARGDARTDSDVDLLVVVRDHAVSADDTEIAMLGALSDAELAKDVVALTPQEMEERRGDRWDFTHHALREGRVLYER